MAALNKKPKAEPYSHCEARCSTVRLKEAGGTLLGQLVCRQSPRIVRIELTGDGAGPLPVKVSTGANSLCAVRPGRREDCCILLEQCYPRIRNKERRGFSGD